MSGLNLSAWALRFEHLNRPGEEHADVGKNFFPRSLLGEAQKIRYQIASAHCLSNDLSHQRILFFGQAFFRPDVLRASQYCGQGVVNFVSRAGD